MHILTIVSAVAAVVFLMILVLAIVRSSKIEDERNESRKLGRD